MRNWNGTVFGDTFKVKNGKPKDPIFKARKEGGFNGPIPIIYQTRPYGINVWFYFAKLHYILIKKY